MVSDRPPYSVTLISPKTPEDRAAKEEARKIREVAQREQLRVREEQDRILINKRQMARSRCITLVKAVDKLCQLNPIEAAEWLEDAFKSAPGPHPTA